MRQRVGRTVFLLLCGLMLVHAGLLVHSGRCHSPTLNEPHHLLAGLHHWRTGTFTLYRVNPPLVRMVATLPLLTTDVEIEATEVTDRVGRRAVFSMTDEFIADNGRRVVTLIQRARWSLIPLSLLGAWVCFAWARDLYGHGAGLFAATLWCFSPMILGHGSLITADAPAAAVGVAAGYAFWRWLRTPTWTCAVIAGTVLGLAELTKLTFLLWLPLWPVLWGVYRAADSGQIMRERWRREAAMVFLQLVVALYVLNLGYLGKGSFTALRDFRFVSAKLAGEVPQDQRYGNRLASSPLGEIPVPLPADYVLGIDVQQRDFEDFGRPSYLRGRYQDHGWWSYYLYVVLVKAPLGTLGLVGLALVTAGCGAVPRMRSADAIVLLLPAIVIFAVVSSKTGFNHHGRYVLPCAPLVWVWISGLAIHCRALFCTVRRVGKSVLQRTRFRRVGGHRTFRCVTGMAIVGCLGATVIGSLVVFPHSLGYFNVAAGGPRNGADHLLHSNIDWGQDLLLLEQWIESRPAEDKKPVYLAFYNSYSPLEFGIARLEIWPFREGSEGIPEVPEGDYAISTNLLYGYQWLLQPTYGLNPYVDPRPLEALRYQRPIGWAGNSIRIFSAEQLRRAYAAPPSWHLSNGVESD